MSKFYKTQIFRTFYANDWKHPESKHFVFQTIDPIPKNAPTFSSNAEKMRKTNSRSI